MSSFASILRGKRIEKALKLSEVAKTIGIDTALVSKIERGDRFATKKQVEAFIAFYALDKKSSITKWLSEKILEELKNEDYALDVLYAAEEQIKYIADNKDKVDIDGELKALLDKVDTLKVKFENIKTTENVKFQNVQDQFNLNYTFESNKFDGNSLSLIETCSVINDGVTIGGKSMHEHLAAINHYDAIEFIEDFIFKNEELNETILKEIHYLILKGINRKGAGKYRNKAKSMPYGSQNATEVILIPKKIQEVFEYYSLNKTKSHPIILAADIHKKLMSIQAFQDGNGKISRLLMNLILLKSGYPFAILKGDINSKKEYYLALESAYNIENDKKFYLLISKSVMESIQEYL